MTERTSVPYFVGLDGGGTRTTAVALDEGGRELGRAEGPPTIVRSEAGAEVTGARVAEVEVAGAEVAAAEVAEAKVAWARVAEVVEALVADLAGSCALELPASAMVAGIAGAGRAAVRSGVQAALEARGLARTSMVTTDVEIAFHAAFGAGPGLLLLAGTGSVALGRASGATVRVGGWGATLGDEGSGYRIGLSALRSSARALDGREDATSLTTEVARAVEAREAQDLVAWVDRASKGDVAALAPLVFTAAGQGDDAAGEILSRATEALVRHAEALRRRLGENAPLVALGGGLITPEGPLRSSLEEALAAAGFEVSPGSPDAARGAAELAMALADREPPEAA